MSARNRQAEKQIRRLSRALRRGRLPRWLDLIEYVKVRGWAQTTGEARRLILDGRVMSESHPLGIKVWDIDGEKRRVLDPLVPARLRGLIYLKEAD